MVFTSSSHLTFWSVFGLSISGLFYGFLFLYLFCMLGSKWRKFKIWAVDTTLWAKVNIKSFIELSKGHIVFPFNLKCLKKIWQILTDCPKCIKRPLEVFFFATRVNSLSKFILSLQVIVNIPTGSEMYMLNVKSYVLYILSQSRKVCFKDLIKHWDCQIDPYYHGQYLYAALLVL